MYLTSWEDCPFTAQFGSLEKSTTQNKLKFVVGAITKQGTEHINKGISNQDALNIAIGENYIVGILCDGCTGTHRDLFNSFSQNQFGSILLSNMLINLCKENIEPRKNKIKPEKFLKWLTLQTKARLRQCLNTIRQTENMNHAVQNLLSSTIIGFVIREKEFFVFHLGDGVVQINQQLYDLSAHSETYFSTHMINPEKQPEFRLIESGLSKNLDNLMIASDGFKNQSLLHSKPFSKFVTKQVDSESNCIIDLIPEMHLKVLNPFFKQETQIRDWPKDDASLILLRSQKSYAKNK